MINDQSSIINDQSSICDHQSPFINPQSSKNWSSFHDLSYEQYLERFYSHNPFLNNDYSKDFEYFIKILKSRRWMDDYPKQSGLDSVCKKLSKRLSFSNNLGDALIYYKKYENNLNSSFDKYFEDAIKEFL